MKEAIPTGNSSDLLRLTEKFPVCLLSTKGACGE